MYERLRKRMPELAHDCQFSGGDTTTTSYGSVSSSGFWSKHRDDVSYNQLLKFWTELSPQARQELLRIDKQTLFEQARKNMYCSRCNGLLLEGFLQIVMYGKSLQQEGTIGQGSGNRLGNSKCQNVNDACLTIGCNDDVQDPSVHPWGGLTTTRDGTLTLLDCYIYSKYLKGLQNVFDSARARERERELLYPDACGGGGRGWISQGMVGYGRGHGTRETCALHTARLSVDTLVDFWSALGEETRHSLLRMKEEDFMERLMYRFDSKRFCRDCRKNVIREFKELKELKRMRREARCTSWFCVADTSFQYEVTLDTIQADWHQNYADSTGIYQHYEWAVGTGEGKSDILEFENVGLNARVQVSGLDLTGLNACYITLRAWRTDGRCHEVSVKAHALKGQHCVHCRLVVGDGFLTITRGESIRRFFEHAEEAEEEEDDDSMDKDGNELDGECSRPQKHAKSPELAREFLLDAATVIFKEQVEKAFREGTARQNAHSMFVSLALKLLEERVLVACKDIITLEKQFKLLEEEEKEKRNEEERKERRRAKEKEKKLRRKERLRNKEKEKEKENKCSEKEENTLHSPNTQNEELAIINSEPNINNTTYSEQEENTLSSVPATEDYIPDEQISNYENSNGNELFTSDHLKNPRRRLKFWKDYQLDQPSKWSDRRPRFHADVTAFEASRNANFKPVRRSNGSRYNERSHCSHNRCNCYQDYRPKVGKPDPDIDISKPYYRGNKYNNNNNSNNNNNPTEYGREGSGRVKTTALKKVWEPRSNSDFDRSGSTDVSGLVKVVISLDGPDPTRTNNGDNNNDLKESKSNVHVENEVDATSSTCGNSNSDSCSSSLSEGDGNTSFSSNPQNLESSSTSDSEYASQNGELSSKITKSYEKNDIPVSHDNIIPPPLQAQSIHFPVFQAPSVGYYHQGPVPWTTGPVNGPGLVPLAHPNPYLFPNPFGYGSRFVQYGVGGLQPLGPQLLNHSQVPLYQPASPVNGTKVVPVLQKSDQVETNSEKPRGQNGNFEKTQKGETGFSLFHFGGPVDVSNGFKPDAAAESDANRSLSVLSETVHGCGTKDAVEEYNLFAASNGIRFSFF